MMRIEMIGEDNCSGCYACANACVQGAIRMKENSEGFVYPAIDHALCIGCKACDRACPKITLLQHSRGEEENKQPDAYAAICHSTHIRDKSSSGGVFRLLAEKIIRGGGSVYGAAFTPSWEVHHCSVDNVAELEKLQGSKYVQSCIGTIYMDVKKSLIAGSQVLFSGTPCQCEGLRSYLGKEYEGLYLVDLICHGVPSPLVWRKYLQHVRKLKKDAQISRISFRSKNLSWERYLLEFTFVNSSKYRNDLYTDIYLRGFLQNLYLRRSCYRCSCRKMYRFSDLTIADFWGIQDVMPSMYDGKGTSLILVQNEKGRKLFSGIDADIKRVDFEQAIRGNPSYLQSPAMNPRREKFFFELGLGREFCTLLNECLKESTSKRIKNRLRNIKILRDIYHCIQK